MIKHNFLHKGYGLYFIIAGAYLLNEHPLPGAFLLAVGIAIN